MYKKERWMVVSISLFFENHVALYIFFGSLSGTRSSTQPIKTPAPYQIFYYDEDFQRGCMLYFFSPLMLFFMREHTTHCSEKFMIEW